MSLKTILLSTIGLAAATAVAFAALAETAEAEKKLSLIHISEPTRPY